MNSRSILTFMACSVLAIAASAHQPTFVPLGWSGPYYDGSTASGHPEATCGSFTNYACIVAAAHNFGAHGLHSWRINVSNTGGLSTYYCTNKANTPGWIVVIGITGLSWGFQAVPGTGGPGCSGHSGLICQKFTPGVVAGIASLSWGGSRYYQVSHAGSDYTGTGPCF